MITEPAAIRDEIELLTRSIDDARREHASGELDAAGLAAIEERDGTRLADASARLAAIAPRPEAAPAHARTSRVHRSRRLLAVGVACVALAAGVLALAVAQPFAAPPTPLRATRATEVEVLLGNGEVLLRAHHPLRALTAFDAALRLAPRNPEALVESAWLRYEFAGLGARDRRETELGFAELRRAVRLAPSNAGAHLYYGVALLGDRGARAAARRQLLEAAALPESRDEQALTVLMLSYVWRR